MSSRKVYILGNNNRVDSEVTGLVAINCEGQSYTAEDSGKSFFNNNGLVVNEYGITATVRRRSATLSGTGNTISSNDQITLFFLDASGGNVAVTLEHSEIDRIFVRKDGTANTAIITPDSGLINGDPNYDVSSQYEKISIVSDGTDLYF